MSARTMCLPTAILVVTLLALAQSQEDGKNCTCFTEKQLEQEIQSQAAVQVERLVKPIVKKLGLLGTCPLYPASSCKEIFECNANSTSGLYWLKTSNGSSIEVFCDMTRTCGGVTGGWMKVTKLDMTNATNQCPPSLRNRPFNGKRLCARPQSSGGCSSVQYQTQGIGYNEVCGKVIGYQFGSTDANFRVRGRVTNVNGNYIDGISLTHGRPRSHIWTFISALHEDEQYSKSTCRCTNNNQPGAFPPTFVGNDYFCDTGSRKRYQLKFYSDPLWNGAGCGPLDECCTFQNPPWFYKNLTSGTGDDIEMRVCRDEAVSNEDVLLEKVEIYVR